MIIGTNKDRINITPSTTADAKSASGLLPTIKLIVIDSCVKQIQLDDIVRFGARKEEVSGQIYQRGAGGRRFKGRLNWLKKSSVFVKESFLIP